MALTQRNKDDLEVIQDQLRAKLTDQRTVGNGGSIDLKAVAQDLRQLLASLDPTDRRQLVVDALQPLNSSYAEIGLIIEQLNPYGLQTFMTPDFAAARGSDLADVKALGAAHGIEVAGWLQAHVANVNPMVSSDNDRMAQDKVQSFKWPFRFPDDLSELRQPDLIDTKDVPANAPQRRDVIDLQITKAVRIPFIYRQSGDGVPPEVEGRLLLGHIVVGYEGAGSE